MNTMTLTYLFLGLLAFVAVIYGQWAGGLTVVTLLVSLSVLQRILNTQREILAELREQSRLTATRAQDSANMPATLSTATPPKASTRKSSIPDSAAFMDALDERIKG